MTRFDRYIKIVRYALRRYSVNGEITTLKRGQPTKFSRIERMAATKYLGMLVILTACLFTGCASVKPVKVQATYKNVTLALDLEIVR